jgi:hypothetical protein
MLVRRSVLFPALSYGSLSSMAKPCKSIMTVWQRMIIEAPYNPCHRLVQTLWLNLQPQIGQIARQSGATTAKPC